MKTISDILAKADEVQTQRGNQYGNAHMRTGDLFAKLFPQGVLLRDPEEFARYNTLSNIIMKINRYCANFGEGGHYDSAIDLINYAAILAHRTPEHVHDRGGEMRNDDDS